jgi:RNA polymerase sigma-70 factor, ECF subfamily
MSLKPTPVVALNRAVAVARVHGPEAGLAAIPSLDHYHWLSATRARLLEWSGRVPEARAAYICALEAAPTAAERRYLKRRLEGVPA